MDILAFDIPFFSGNIDSSSLPPPVIDLDPEPSAHNGGEASISGLDGKPRRRMRDQGNRIPRGSMIFREPFGCSFEEVLTHQIVCFNEEQDPWTANYGVQESFSSPAAIKSQSHTLQDFSSFHGSSSPQQRVDFSSLQLYQSQAESEDLAFWEKRQRMIGHSKKWNDCLDMVWLRNSVAQLARS
ncbi:hypothetical protein QYF36_022486 [Acer negundo]|nr:hypothetical protein QYF36_022486 [Acer negundo]